MKKILIIYPHFPPSNLAGVHRPRLFAQHLPQFGWEPVVLTVHEKYYEETPDYNLVKLLPPELQIVKVPAIKVSRPRLIGDIGLRAFFQLYRRAKRMIRAAQFDFLYIPIPSFYCALLGRWLHQSTGIRYGIDYIDPWVHHFPGSDKVFSRHWFSTQLASILEPIAVKKASLITGVAAGYYKGVLDRNPHLVQQAVAAAMPYGGEKSDHLIVKTLQLAPYLFTKKEGVFQLVYAGAMLPKAYSVLEAVFQSIQRHISAFSNVEFHFIGTGNRVDDPDSYTIKPLAEKYGLWQTVVFEYARRIPYLDVLVHLECANAAFILGSTEPHYTPSKVYQSILAGKPVFAVLHEQSTASKVVETANAGVVLNFSGEETVAAMVGAGLYEKWNQFVAFKQSFDPTSVNVEAFDKYSAYAVTRQLAESIDQALK